VLSKNEEKQLRKALRQTFLDGYPNPERKGCPGTDILRAIASGKLTLEEAEPWILHFGSCSPCTREFSEFRQAFEKRRLWRFGAIAAILLVAVSVLAWVFLRQSIQPARFEVASLDLTGRGVMRGSDENPPNPPLELDKAHLDLTIILPLGSEAGPYDVQVVRVPEKPLLSAQGTAAINDHRAMLHIQVDLSRLDPGLYLLAVRPKNWGWTYYPLVLK